MKPLGKNQSKRHAAALTLIEVLVVIALIVILAGFLLSSLSRSGPASQAVCMGRLKQIGLGFRIWADDNGGKFPMEVSVTNHGTLEYLPSGIAYIHFLKITNHVMAWKTFVCPKDSGRQPATNSNVAFNNSNLSYFLTESLGMNSAAAVLSGDRNLTMNGVLLRRGLVEIYSNSPIGWGENIHPRGGNILFADNHVEGTRANTINQKFQATGLTTNRLLLP